jgi:hypothetical protein
LERVLKEDVVKELLKGNYIKGINVLDKKDINLINERIAKIKRDYYKNIPWNL